VVIDVNASRQKRAMENIQNIRRYSEEIMPLLIYYSAELQANFFIRSSNLQRAILVTATNHLTRDQIFTEVRKKNFS